MTKAEIMAVIKTLVSKAAFTAAIDALAAAMKAKHDELAEAIDTKVSKTYRPAGNIAAAGLVDTLLVEANLGKVYHLTDDATTTDKWLEGAGNTVVAGTDVGIVEVDGENEGEKAYKFNSFAGASYLQATDFETITEEEAVAIVTAALAKAEADDDENEEGTGNGD